MAVGRRQGWTRADGHLDESGGVAFGGGAGDPGGLVGEVQLVFETVELGADDLAGDGVEQGVETQRAVEQGGGVAAVAGRFGPVGVVSGGGVGLLAPVVDGVGCLGVTQVGAHPDEQGLVAHEQVVTVGLVGVGEQVDGVHRHPPVGHRRRGGGHRGEAAGAAQLDSGRGQRRPGVAGQARRGGARPVAGPNSGRVPAGQQPGPGAGETVARSLQADHDGVELGVGKGVGVDVGELGDGLVEPGQQHVVHMFRLPNGRADSNRYRKKSGTSWAAGWDSERPVLCE